MQTLALTAFLTDAEQRARRTGVADMSVESLRNKGSSRTETKRRLLANAAARTGGRKPALISYF